jgi:hypothetical protein
MLVVKDPTIPLISICSQEVGKVRDAIALPFGEEAPDIMLHELLDGD